MATITKFEELDMWQKSRLLSKDIFFHIETGGLKKDYKLIEQINAASGSIMDNIAEGFERGSKLEFINFLSYSKGSAGEVKSQLYRAFDRNYLTEEKFKDFYNRTDEITKMITSFISYLNKANIKGQKFKDRR
ncbi:MAG: four helix bundle protein [Lacibacter sp.]